MEDSILEMLDLPTQIDHMNDMNDLDVCQLTYMFMNVSPAAMSHSSWVIPVIFEQHHSFDMHPRIFNFYNFNQLPVKIIFFRTIINNFNAHSTIFCRFIERMKYCVESIAVCIT